MDVVAKTLSEQAENLVQCAMFRAPDENDMMRDLLNDDCTVEVLNRMPTNDLIIGSCLCEHCADLIRTCVIPRRNINIDDVHKFFDIREVFEQFGSSITDLTVHRRHIPAKSISKTNSDSQQLLDLLTHHCTNDSLKKLDIELNFNDIDTKSIEAFANKLQNLNYLTITASHYNSSHRKTTKAENDHEVEVLLQHSVKLKTIHAKMMPISGAFLYRTPIKHLTELALVQCEQIEMDALVESAAHFKCLRRFVWQNSKFDGIQSISETIFGVCDILGREFDTVHAVALHMNYGIKYCQRIGDRSVLDGLKKLPHLKQLSIGLAGACACNDFFHVIRQLEQLKSFAIESPILFAGRSCMPCTKVIANYVPNIFDKLRNLTSLRIVHINSHHSTHLFDEIVDNLKHIEELHLVGIRGMSDTVLLSLVRNMPKLTILSLLNTKLRFTAELYANLVAECQTNVRHVKITIGKSVRHTLLARVAGQYRKEYVQIIAD